jgi:hypothetical protein
MTEPEAYCAVCNRRRSAMRHMHNRTLGPAKAAMQWLKKHCSRKDDVSHIACDVKYRAGVDVEGLKAVLTKRGIK